MAIPTLRADRIVDTPAQRAVIVEVQRLYRQMRDLPAKERPDVHVRGAGAAYLALEAEIHALAVRYQGMG